MAVEPSKTAPSLVPAQTAQMDVEQLGRTIGDAVADGMARHSPKKVTVGQYLKRRQEGRSKLTRSCTQNGYEMRDDNLTNEEIDLLNRIKVSGRYFDRKVEVIVRNEGSEEEVEFRYSNKTPDQRNDLRGYYRSLTDMLTQILAEQGTKGAKQAGVG